MNALRTFFCFAATAAIAAPQAPESSPLDAATAGNPTWPPRHVVHDATPDGRLWAHGGDWKASFGAEGFTFVPYLPGAAHNWPLQFRLASLRVGGAIVPIDGAVRPTRRGDRITFARGPVHELYELAPKQVEQRFVVDVARAGDIEIELALTTELQEDPARPGLQFASENGEVLYGDAFVVRGSDRLPIATELAGNRLRLRVPAALRGDGPVEIDPILSTRSSTTSGANRQADVAWDATNARYLLSWEFDFSATDHDIWTELFDAAGVPIPNSALSVDISSALAISPRCADLHDADRFLIAFQYTDPLNNNRRMIYSRTRDAGGATAVGAYTLLSDPALPGDNSGPDVGADSATGPGNHDWLVVWTNTATINDANIHGRLVLGSGQPRQPGVLPIQTAGTSFNANVQVSKGNGNGVVPHPAWCVVYNRHFGATVSEVHCHTVDPVGVVGSEQPVDNTQQRNLNPQVSSPLWDGSRTRYLVTYRRESGNTARAVCIGFAPAWQSSQFIDLTQQFGILADWQRVDSDGVRFVVASKGFFALEFEVRTLGWTGVSLVEHDVSGGQSLAETEVVSARASGGEAGIYALTRLANATSGPLPQLTRYGGYQLGAAFGSLPTACSALQIQASGYPLLGGSVQFTLSNFGSDFPGFAFGGAATIPIPVCPSCSLGLRFDLPIVPMLATSSAAIAIPTTLGLLGQTYAMQGFGFGASPCLGGFTFSDTITFTIR